MAAQGFIRKTMFLPNLVSHFTNVAKVFNRRKSSNDRRLFGPKAHCSVPLVCRGHCPSPGNFENVYSQRCIFLDFGDKMKK